MKPRLFLAAMVAFAMMHAAEAQVAAIIGEGNDSCAAWIKEREAARSGVITRKFGSMTSWVTGYVSGVNSTLATLAAPDKEDILLESGIKPNEIFDHIDRYCRDSPGATLFAAANDLIITLQTRTIQNRRSRRPHVAPNGPQFVPPSSHRDPP